jgi:hypothetical protein
MHIDHADITTMKKFRGIMGELRESLGKEEKN